MDVVVIGAGILGLAHAWSAAKRGHRVTVFERTRQASGASIRNFGMVWPIGQPSGHCHQVALRSRAAWLELASEAGIWVDPCGSIHLAHRDDEWQVLQEFAALAPQLGYDCQLLTPAEIERYTPAARQHGLRGGLRSETELCVQPPAAIRAIPAWLSQRFGVAFHFGHTVTAVDQQQVITASGIQKDFDRLVICSGTDGGTLFPQTIREAGLRLCKLQMLKTQAQPDGWRLGTHLASGLTLRHYTTFAQCPGLAALRDRISTETPELDRYGIHVMASQNDTAGVILGDSHEYDAEIEPFDNELIDELILRELRAIISLPNWSIAQRWHGYYYKYAAGPVLTAEPQPGVSMRVGAGGSGMTMSFGLAEWDWEQWQ